MVKRLMIANRTIGVTPHEADKSFRDHLGADLPLVLPVEGWRREGLIVDISSEQFPGSHPIWIWTEQ